MSRGVDPANLRPLYELSLSHAEIVAKASIPVDKINGRILLRSGKDDRMWPASEMADSLVARLKEKKFPHTYEHVAYDDAGHTLNEFFMMGRYKRREPSGSSRQLAANARLPFAGRQGRINNVAHARGTRWRARM